MLFVSFLLFLGASLATLWGSISYVIRLTDVFVCVVVVGGGVSTPTKIPSYLAIV